jgi:hypothetical protein
MSKLTVALSNFAKAPNKDRFSVSCPSQPIPSFVPLTCFSSLFTFEIVSSSKELKTNRSTKIILTEQSASTLTEFL